MNPAALQRLSREFVPACDLGGIVRDADDRAVRRLAVTIGQPLRDLCAAGTGDKADLLLTRARDVTVEGWELALIVDGRPATISVAATFHADQIWLVGTLVPEHFARALDTVEDAMHESLRLHRELVVQKRELQRRHDELTRVSRELEDFNRGLLTLHGEVAEAARELRRQAGVKDEFLAMLAHELRDPLAAVTTAHAILDAYPARDATEARARDIARRQAAQLGRIVDDLLDVSRMMRGIITLKRERVDLAALLTQVTAMAAQVKLHDHDRKLTLSAPHPVHIDGDPTRLLQIFSNLIDNAIKFTAPGGAIDVSLRDVDGMAVVCVRDDGVGMDDAALEQVFTMFFQAQTSIHRSRGGLGIGLTLTRALAELHGGTAVARSDGPGRGVELEVRLPLARTGTLDASVPEPAPSSRSIRLLIVEDNTDIREILEALCDSWGHRVQVACDRLEGASMALESRPDVALVDIGLPGIDGFEVARRIRADPRGAAMKLIALSGYGSPVQRAEARAAGFDHHVVKPADPDRLAALLLSATEP